MQERKNRPRVEDESFDYPYLGDFAYNPESQVFQIGNPDIIHTLPLTEIDDLIDIHVLAAGLGASKTRRQRPPTLGWGGMGTANLIAFPALRRWIAGMSEEERSTVAERVESTMVETFRTLFPNSTSSFRSEIPDPVRLHAEDGAFTLYTYGDRTGIYADRGHKLGLDEAQHYYVHNADTRAMRLSLYAGSGTLAWLMEQQR